MPRPASSRLRPWMWCVGMLLAVAPFVPATTTFFISDDIQMVLFGATTSVSELAWLPSSRWTWHRPLPALTWILNYAAAGAQPFWWHLPNLGLHALNCALAWRLARQFTASTRVASLTVLLFAWSPVTPGTVTWISARPDLLAMAFTLATVVTACEPRLASRPFAQAMLMAMWTLLAISSKESAFALLPVSLVLFLGPRLLPAITARLPGRWDPPTSFARWRVPVIFPLVVGALLVGFLLARAWLYGSTLGGYGAPLSARRLISAPLLGPAAVVSVVRLAMGTAGHAWLALGGGALASLVLVRVSPLWAACGLAAVLPAAHLIGASLPLWEYDRFYYQASFWLAGGIASALVHLHREGSRRVATALAALLVLGNLAYLATRLEGLRRASAVTRGVDTALRAARSTLPPGSVVVCAGLPDNVDAAYAYRNGCLEHVRLVWPGQDVTAVMRPEDAPAGAPVFQITADGLERVP